MTDHPENSATSPEATLPGRPEPHPFPPATAEPENLRRAVTTPGDEAHDAPAPQAETPTEREADSKPRVKIGTQREGAVAPRLPPRVKTTFVTPDPNQPKPAPPVAPTPPVHSSPSVEPVAPAPSPPVAPTPPAAVEAAATPAAVPPGTSQQISAVEEPTSDTSVSSESADPFVPKPAQLEPGKGVRKPVVQHQTGAKVPTPNLRAELPPDLAQEMDEALGGMSLDDLIGAESRGPEVAEQLEPEARVRGKVLRLHREDVFVDLPGRNQGVISSRQFLEPPPLGGIVDLVVTRFNADEGLYELTVPGGAVHVGDWSQVSEGMVVEAHVTGHNKGGLECEVNHLRAFIPMSQIALGRVEQPEEFVGQKFACVVTEVDPDRQKLVLSRRATLEREQAEAKEKMLASLAAGQIHEGVVRSVRDFGAFVDLGGVDGLLHVSQISWDRIKHPGDVLKVGQKIRVKIDKINPENQKISLSHRELLENPWANAAAKYPITSRVQGTVSKLTEFGAFVRLEAGVEGLIHISELAHQRVHRAGDIVAEGQSVEVKVLSVDQDAQRISLSLKALQARPEPIKKAEPEPEPEPVPSPASKRSAPLKGGLGRSPLGDKFGLKW